MEKDKGFGPTVFLIGAALIPIVIIANKLEGPPNVPEPKKIEQRSTPVPRIANWQREARAKAEVEKLLKDSDSAKFTNLEVSTTSGAHVVCGAVNSRNSFGAMSGNQRFISGTVTVLEEQLGADEMNKIWSRVC